MANPSVNAPEQSLGGRLRRELRNPSMMTVGLIILAVAAIPLIMLVPSWVSTTKESFQAREREDALRDAALLSSNVIVPSQITPWMLLQIKAMEEAEGPTDWNQTSFTEGPCHTNNLSQLPAGPYADAIAASCTALHDIQKEYAGNCTSIFTCNIPDEATVRLNVVRADLLDAFSEAGFVLPYSFEEEQSGP